MTRLAVPSVQRPRRTRAVELGGERRSPAMQAVVLVLSAGALLYFLLPLYWLIVASTKSNADLFATPGFAFARFDLFENLRLLTLHDGGIFWRWMLNSLIYSGVGAVLMTFVSVLSGYALAMYRFRGRTVVLAAVLGSLLVPSTVLAQPTYVLLTHLGLVNTYAGVLVPSLVYPFGVMLAFVYAQGSIPGELLEAARLDGAGEFRIFRSIGIQLMSSGTVTILLFAFLGSWNNYLLPLLVLNDISIVPVTVGLTGWFRESISVPGLQGLLVVGSLVSVLPVAAVFLSLQRYWRAGLTAGGLRM